MSAVLAMGALAGLGLFLLIVALVPRRLSLARRIAALDEVRPPVSRAVRQVVDERESELSRRLGRALAAFCAEQGWQFPSLRANLSLIGKSFENYLATKVLLALLGFLAGPVFLLAVSAAGFHVSLVLPVWFGAALAAVFFFLPDLEVKQKADARRRDFRHAIGAFLDLVSMNLSGGRGVPEALMAASEIGSGLGPVADQGRAGQRQDQRPDTVAGPGHARR